MSKTKYRSINREKLLAMADDLAVLRAYTEVGKKNGNRYQIKCPDHPDQHFGSCWYFLKDRRYHCFACHSDGNMIDIVMHKNGWTEPKQAYDAMREIAELSCLDIEDVSDEVTPETQKKLQSLPPMPTQEEMALIGIHNECVRVTCMNEIDEPDKPEQYISNPLGRLRMEDEETFRMLIISKCKEKIINLNNEIKNLSTLIGAEKNNETLALIQALYSTQSAVKSILAKYEKTV